MSCMRFWPWGQSRGSVCQTLRSTSRHFLEGWFAGGRRRAGWTQRIRWNTPVLDALPLASHFARVTAVVTDDLRALVRNMLGDRCQEVRVRKHLEVSVDLRVQLGAVNDLTVSGVERRFGHRKWVAKDVLGEWFEDGLVLRRNAFAVMRVKSVVFPGMQKVDSVMWQQVEVDQRLDDLCAEDFFPGV